MAAITPDNIENIKAMTKLTSDQKRAKKKKAEIKEKARRQHEANAFSKKAFKAIDAMHRLTYMHSAVDPAAFAEAINIRNPTPNPLPGISAFKKTTAFQEIKKEVCFITELHEMSYNSKNHNFSLCGRVYVAKKNGDGVDCSAAPSVIWYASDKPPEDTVIEYFNMAEGGVDGVVHLIGIRVLESCAYVALVYAGDDEEVEMFFVGKTGWYLIKNQPLVLNMIIDSVGNEASEKANQTCEGFALAEFAPESLTYDEEEEVNEEVFDTKINLYERGSGDSVVLSSEISNYSNALGFTWAKESSALAMSMQDKINGLKDEIRFDVESEMESQVSKLEKELELAMAKLKKMENTQSPIAKSTIAPTQIVRPLDKIKPLEERLAVFF